MSINNFSEIYIFLSWGKWTDHLKGHKDWSLDCHLFTFLKDTNYDITFIILHSLSLNNCVKLYLVGGGEGGYSVELLKTATQDHKIKAPWNSDLNCFSNLKSISSLIKDR